MCPRSAPSTSTEPRRPRPAILGHRGGALEAPENTLAAIAHAAGCGADGVELDVRLTADGVPVVVHDADLVRLAGRPLRIAEATAAELATISLTLDGDARGLPSRIPTLARALAAAAPLSRLDLDLKSAGDAGRLASAVIGALDVAGRGTGVLLTSFDPDTLAALHRLRPELPCAAILEAPPAGTLWAAWPAVALEVALARSGWALEARRRGLAVLVWTENDPARLADWQRAGVSAVITDRPARMVVASEGPV